MTKQAQSWLVLVTAGFIALALTLWRLELLPNPGREATLVMTPESPPPEDRTASAAPDSAIKHPIGDPAAHPLGADEVTNALINLIGKDAVESFLQIDEFPRRFVATVDNLGRPHVPRLIWPVKPTPERFIVDELEDSPALGPANFGRYTPFVVLAETVSASRAVDLYARLYPLFQHAYEGLGFPDRYFNDRLIAVIDLLLDTPEVAYPLRLQLIEVKGPIPSQRPWVRYEFADPELERLSAGQKILLRIGPANQGRLKRKLAEIRHELIKRATR